MATRTHPKPRVPQRVAAPRRGPREGRRALDPAPARMGASGAVMKPMAQLNRAPQHRAPLIAMRSSAVRARMRAVGIESLSAAKLGFVRKILAWREAIFPNFQLILGPRCSNHVDDHPAPACVAVPRRQRGAACTRMTCA